MERAGFHRRHGVRFLKEPHRVILNVVADAGCIALHGHLANRIQRSSMVTLLSGGLIVTIMVSGSPPARRRAGAVASSRGAASGAPARGLHMKLTPRPSRSLRRRRSSLQVAQHLRNGSPCSQRCPEGPGSAVNLMSLSLRMMSCAARAGVNLLVCGVRVAGVRQVFRGGGEQPHPLHLLQFGFGVPFAVARIIHVAGFLEQIQIVRRRRVGRISLTACNSTFSASSRRPIS